MQKLTIQINTQNDAFGTNDNSNTDEIAWILRKLADNFEFWGTGHVAASIRDSNGNSCGKVSTK